MLSVELAKAAKQPFPRLEHNVAVSVYGVAGTREDTGSVAAAVGVVDLLQPRRVAADVC
jgi:hypothetical protein